jgi:hypothetical protein
MRDRKKKVNDDVVDFAQRVFDSWKRARRIIEIEGRKKG